jgi:hypothetical protein
MCSTIYAIIVLQTKLLILGLWSIKGAVSLWEVIPFAFHYIHLLSRHHKCQMKLVLSSCLIFWTGSPTELHPWSRVYILDIWVTVLCSSEQFPFTSLPDSQCTITASYVRLVQYIEAIEIRKPITLRNPSRVLTWAPRTLRPWVWILYES